MNKKRTVRITLKYKRKFKRKKQLIDQIYQIIKQMDQDKEIEKVGRAKAADKTDRIIDRL